MSGARVGGHLGTPTASPTWVRPLGLWMLRKYDKLQLFLICLVLLQQAEWSKLVSLPSSSRNVESAYIPGRALTAPILSCGTINRVGQGAIVAIYKPMPTVSATAMN